MVGQRVKRRLEAAKAQALGKVYDAAKRAPFVRERISSEYDSMFADLDESLRPYKDDYPVYSALPEKPQSRSTVLDMMKDLAKREESRWRDGYVSGAVYHGDAKHIDFLNEVYALSSQANPLHTDLWPSAVKYEAEIVAMTANMLGAVRTRDEICGTVTSGGTESILLAMKAYRDQARAHRGIRRPELVAPETAHAAFDKAAQYFEIGLRKIPIGKDFRVDLRQVKAAITKNTIALVGSAPCFPHGVIDPIEDLANLAAERRIGMHVDACLGGFVLPFARELGRDIPEFDFAIDGVTSMSVDTHKYGYAAKGTSVVLYRGNDLRHHQYFTATDWPGGLYFSPTLAGSRPGALSAAAWAAMVTIGRPGYIEGVRRILQAADTIKAGIDEIDGIYRCGDALWVIAFASNHLPIYRIMDAMTKRGWNLNGLHKPSCVHIAVTLRTAETGVAERLVEDLRAAVSEVGQEGPDASGGMAPIYGLASSIPFRGAVSDMLEGFLDRIYKL